jgi:ribose transport system permease protein
MERKINVRKILESKIFSLLIMLIVIVVFFTVASKGTFLSPNNFVNILNASVIVGLLAIGEGFLIISGYIDLSAGAIGCMCGVLAAFLISGGMAWPLVVILLIVIGAACGVFNAMLVNVFNFQPFIATLATASVLRGIAYAICGGIAIAVNVESYLFIGGGRFLGVPPTVYIMLILLIIYGIALAKTKFGRSIYLIGGNATAARLAGLNPKKMSYILFANSGAMAALAGFFLTSRLKTGSPLGVVGSEFSAITGAILGGISFGGGSGNMFGCFVGIVIINLFNNGLTVLGINTFAQQCAAGILLLVALTLDYFSNKSKARV